MRRPAILSLVLLGGCSLAPPQDMAPPPLPQRGGVDPLVAARAEGVEFRAHGAGFVLDIMRADVIALTLDNSRHVFTKPIPRYPRWNGVIYDTANADHTLVVHIRDDRPCESDDHTTYPTTVELRFDGREYEGCGRRL